MKKTSVSPSLFLPPGYAHYVELNSQSLIVTAGGVPLDENGRVVGGDNIAKQTDQVIKNLLIVLDENELTLDHVVKIIVYVASTQSEELAIAWKQVRKSGLANDTVAATLLGVTVLGYPGQLVEIDLWASRTLA